MGRCIAYIFLSSNILGYYDIIHGKNKHIQFIVSKIFFQNIEIYEIPFSLENSEK